MNRSELIVYLAEKANLPRRTAEMVVSTVFESMTQALANGERIEIRGFGSFISKSYGSYMGRNPRTGDPVFVNPKRQPLFKVGKDLRERVDGELDEIGQHQHSTPESDGLDGRNSQRLATLTGGGATD